MKKIMLVLAVLFVAVPVYAAEVDCNCEDSGGGLVTVSFTNNLTGDGNNVRAIALNISSGAADVNKGSVDSVGGSGYWVYPGSIDINDTTGLVDNNGTPLCSTNYPGTWGANPNEMTVEMASLYEKGVESAPSQTSNNVLTFSVDGSCTVTLAANVIRGGVVLEDPNNPVSVGYGTCDIVTNCYTGPNEGRWIAMGEPNCWCWDKDKIPDAVPRQCRGDADDVNEGIKSNKPVLSYDLAVFLAAWNRNDNKAKVNTINVGGKDVLWICADYDHNAEGINTNKGTLSLDLAIFLANWNRNAPKVPPCP